VPFRPERRKLANTNKTKQKHGPRELDATADGTITFPGAAVGAEDGAATELL
jgi:hypothetical protein